jgi:hypothetical protein
MAPNPPTKTTFCESLSVMKSGAVIAQSTPQTREDARHIPAPDVGCSLLLVGVSREK